PGGARRVARRTAQVRRGDREDVGRHQAQGRLRLCVLLARPGVLRKEEGGQDGLRFRDLPEARPQVPRGADRPPAAVEPGIATDTALWLAHLGALAAWVGPALVAQVALWRARARGLRQTAAPPFSKDLARGIGMDDMIRALAAPLLGIGVPLIVWLSVKHPF